MLFSYMHAASYVTGVCLQHCVQHCFELALQMCYALHLSVQSSAAVPNDSSQSTNFWPYKLAKALGEAAYTHKAF